jgi:hypothetical protein
MHALLHRNRRDLEIEVVWQGVHARVDARERVPHRLLAARIDAQHAQPLAIMVWREKRRQRLDVHVCEYDLLHVRVLQQIVRARRALQPGAEHQHSHL